MHTAIAALVCSVLLTVGSSAQDWPHWRGARYDGSAPAEGLPTDFDQTKSVRWACDLPGPSACTPIVIGERVFLSSVDGDKLVALCLRRTDGEVLWRKDAGGEYSKGIAKDPRSNYASPSPTTDGERVVFFFGNGDLVAYDFAGAEQWRRNIQEDYGDFAFQWTFSASPTLFEGKLFLPVLQRDEPVGGGRGRGRGRGRRQAEAPPVEASAPRAPSESFILAINPANGETIYKHVRPSPARMESLESYTTMIPWSGEDGRQQMLLVGGDVLTGHDPATGKELWRWGTWNPGHRERSWRLVPSVVTGAGVALACGPKRAPVFAIKLGGSGELDDEALVWQSEGRPNPVSTDVPTPAFDAGFFYVLSDLHAALSKVDAEDGKVVWTRAMPGEYLWRASPTVADGKVWCINHNGEVVVIDAGNGEIVHRAAMGTEDDDQIRSSVVVAHGALFIRTNSKLFCVGS